MEASRSAVFDMIVGLILAAIEHHSPKRAEAEGIIGLSVARGGILSEHLSRRAARVVISSRENAGAFSVCKLGDYVIDRIKFFGLAAVVGDISIKHEHVESVAKISTCLDGNIVVIVDVCEVVYIKLIRVCGGFEVIGCVGQCLGYGTVRL